MSGFEDLFGTADGWGVVLVARTTEGVARVELFGFGFLGGDSLTVTLLLPLCLFLL